MNRSPRVRLHPCTSAAYLVVMLASCMVPTGCRTPARVGVPGVQPHEFRQLLMGVQVRVVVFAEDEAEARAAASAAFDEIARLNMIMSDYDDSSEIMRLVRRPPRTPQAISADLETVLAAGQAMASRTSGLFDVTVGPLVRLWRQARRDQILPASDSIDAARQRTGWTLLQVHRGYATLGRDQMLLDLGGIAKGYAAQRAVDLLRRNGYPCCMVAMAGDVVAGDAPPGSRGWRVTIETGNSGRISQQLSLANRAVSTSGDTEQFVEIDGTRYSHIVDPRTGMGLINRTAATVIAPEGTTADSLASALCVAGIDHAEAILLQFPGCAAIIEQVRLNGIERRTFDPEGMLDEIITVEERSE